MCVCTCVQRRISYSRLKSNLSDTENEAERIRRQFGAFRSLMDCQNTFGPRLPTCHRNASQLATTQYQLGFSNIICATKGGKKPTNKHRLSHYYLAPVYLRETRQTATPFVLIHCTFLAVRERAVKFSGATFLFLSASALPHRLHLFSSLVACFVINNRRGGQKKPVKTNTRSVSQPQKHARRSRLNPSHHVSVGKSPSESVLFLIFVSPPRYQPSCG